MRFIGGFVFVVMALFAGLCIGGCYDDPPDRMPPGVYAAAVKWLPLADSDQDGTLDSGELKTAISSAGESKSMTPEEAVALRWLTRHMGEIGHKVSERRRNLPTIVTTAVYGVTRAELDQFGANAKK